MRLQVFLSHSGACSRRKALDLILQGRVTVSGKTILEPSYPVTDVSGDIALDGKNIILPKEKIYVLLNKPKGVITTRSDRFADRKVIDLLPQHLKNLYPVGRLDKDTTGLLLLTNDGELTHRMIHPSFETEKAYYIVLNKPLKPQDKEQLEKGILLDDKATSPCRVTESGKEVEIIIHEGRKRQVRRMFSFLHYHVEELVRTRQGPLSLGELKEGEWRFLTKDEVKLLRSI